MAIWSRAAAHVPGAIFQCGSHLSSTVPDLTQFLFCVYHSKIYTVTETWSSNSCGSPHSPLRTRLIRIKYIELCSVLNAAQALGLKWWLKSDMAMANGTGTYRLKGGKQPLTTKHTDKRNFKLGNCFKEKECAPVQTCDQQSDLSGGCPAEQVEKVREVFLKTWPLSPQQKAKWQSTRHFREWCDNEESGLLLEEQAGVVPWGRNLLDGCGLGFRRAELRLEE